MKVLLSIKPEHVNKIFAGTKKYEFRKSLFRKRDVKSVIIYASSPIKRIVGEFEIDYIISDDVNIVWKKTKKHSGITETFYNSYFYKRTIANAIRIGNLIKYETPKSLSDFNIRQAPQSFCYVKE